MQTVVFPRGWRSKWADVAQALLTFKKLFASNTHDDAPDALTGLVEKSYSIRTTYKYQTATLGV